MIDVDGALRTSVKGVYAIRDLVRGPALAHQGVGRGHHRRRGRRRAGTHPSSIDIPRATFCRPRRLVRAHQEQAKEQGNDVVVGKVNSARSAPARSTAAAAG